MPILSESINELAAALVKVQSQLVPPCSFRNPSHKHPERHRRVYERAGQIWPEDLGKHLRRGAALEEAEKAAERPRIA